MTLIWGVRQVGTDEERSRARYLFQRLDEEEDPVQIIIPSVVVAEYLVPVGQDDRARVAATLSERFRIVPFDIRAASLAARLFDEFKPQRQLGAPGSRDVLKADAMIVASSKVFGAKIFYTDDEECREMASPVMDARPLPDMPTHLYGY